MTMVLRLIFREPVFDSEGRLIRYNYKTDEVVLDEHSPAFDFESFVSNNTLPELIAGEWMQID